MSGPVDAAAGASPLPLVMPRNPHNGDDVVHPYGRSASEPRPAPFVLRERPRRQLAVTFSSRPRSRLTRRVCSWQTRDSVTPSISPISARVWFSW